MEAGCGTGSPGVPQWGPKLQLSTRTQERAASEVRYPAMQGCERGQSGNHVLAQRSYDGGSRNSRTAEQSRVNGPLCAPAAVVERERTDGWRRSFPGSCVPCRWSGVQGLSLRGELFKRRVWKREWLHLSHILLEPLQQMCLLTSRTS